MWFSNQVFKFWGVKILYIYSKNHEFLLLPLLGKLFKWTPKAFTSPTSELCSNVSSVSLVHYFWSPDLFFIITPPPHTISSRTASFWLFSGSQYVVAQWWRVHLPVLEMQETQVQPLGRQNSPGAGSSNPLQYSCLNKSMDGGAWRAKVHGVAESRTKLSMHARTHDT